MWQRVRDVLLGPSLALRHSVCPFELEVLTGNAERAPIYVHGGRSYLLGRPGERYTLRIHNRGEGRVEAVVAVDGRDVVDGEPADPRLGTGYLVPAFGAVDIEGWRLSEGQVAAFRFAAAADSYAAARGDRRGVGVIAAAIYREAPPREVYETRERRCGGLPAPAGMAPRAQGLGTAFGERRDAPVRRVPFAREGARPAALLGLRYDDAAGLRALGVPLPAPREPRFWEPWGDEGPAAPDPWPGRRYARPPRGWSG